MLVVFTTAAGRGTAIMARSFLRTSTRFHKEEVMAQTGAGSRMTGNPLIESDRVEGTTVYDPNGNNIGSISG